MGYLGHAGQSGVHDGFSGTAEEVSLVAMVLPRRRRHRDSTVLLRQESLLVGETLAIDLPFIHHGMAVETDQYQALVGLVELMGQADGVSQQVVMVLLGHTHLLQLYGHLSHDTVLDREGLLQGGSSGQDDVQLLHLSGQVIGHHFYGVFEGGGHDVVHLG